MKKKSKTFTQYVDKNIRIEVRIIKDKILDRSRLIYPNNTDRSKYFMRYQIACQINEKDDK